MGQSSKNIVVPGEDDEVAKPLVATLEDAISFAALCHEGVTDKQGQPYILHCLRVMLSVREDLRIAAVLHDVVEDCGVTLTELASFGYSEKDVNLIGRLTHRDGQTREEYVAIICDDLDAILVKFADIHDNFSRIPGLTNPKEQARLTKKYERDMDQLNVAFAAHCS